MSEKSYSYRKLWKRPIMIHKIFKGEWALVFSRGLELRQFIVAALISLPLLFFHSFVPWPFWLVTYAGIPWLLAGRIVKSNVDGKRIDRYTWGYIHSIRTRKIIYNGDKPIHKSELKKYTYEKFER